MEDAKDRAFLMAADSINNVWQLGVHEEIPTPLIHTFCIAAANEGKTVNELVELVKGNRTTVSRHLLDLSETLRNKQPGYGLLNRVRHPTDLRSVVFVLSPRGKKLVRSLRETMEKALVDLRG